MRWFGGRRNARGLACYGLGIMEIEGRRRSSNFEDRGQGGGGGVPAGGLPIGLLVSLVRVLGFKGVAVLAVIGGAAYFFMPSSLRHQLLGGGDPGEGAQGAGSVCQATPANGKACVPVLRTESSMSSSAPRTATRSCSSKAYGQAAASC